MVLCRRYVSLQGRVGGLLANLDTGCGFGDSGGTVFCVCPGCEEYAAAEDGDFREGVVEG